MHNSVDKVSDILFMELWINEEEVIPVDSVDNLPYSYRQVMHASNVDKS